MTKMIDREEFCKIVVENILEQAVPIADELHAAIERGEAADLDRILRKRMLSLGDALHQESVSQLAQSLRHASFGCPRCGKTMRFKQRRPLVVRTGMTGKERTVLSPYFVCDDCHVGLLALRAVLRLDEDGFTPFLRELSVRAGTVEPYEPAAEELLGGMAGVAVSGSKVHVLCQRAGEAAQALADGGVLGESRKLRSGEKLYVEIDGGMLRIDGEWREAKVAVAFPGGDVCPVSKERRMLSHRRVCATLGTREDLGRLVLEMVTPYLPQTPDGAPVIAGNVVALGDGSVWIRNLVEEHLPGARMILDWYHVVEHVGGAAAVLYPDDERSRRRWRKYQLGLLCKGRVEAMLLGLARLSMELVAGSGAQGEVAALYKYLDERRALLCYCKARNEGLLIGSGAVESAIGHVLQQRMKRSGMRWKSDGAAAMVALRCAYRSSGGMDALFNKINRAA